MNAGAIYFAKESHRAFLKLTGGLRHPLGPRLGRAVHHLFEPPDSPTLIVDLSEAEFLDSTCLGLLARVAIGAMERNWERPVLVSATPELNRVLRSMGFDQVFALIPEPTGPTPAFDDAASLEGIARRPDRKLVLEAHRALCELNTHNRALFQNVVDQLELEDARETAAPEAF